jgi:hypothetical protein
MKYERGITEDKDNAKTTEDEVMKLSGK